MTFAEARNLGYRCGDGMYSRGYVSRRVDIMTQPVKRAGKRGPRARQLYVEVPCYLTTKYHMRQYLIWAGDGPEPEWED